MRFIARQLPVVALAIVGLASTAPPAAAQDGHRYAMTGLRIRTSPSTDSRILATIPRGGRVSIFNCTRDWCRVHYRGTSGWAARRYLSTHPPARPGRNGRHHPHRPPHRE